MSGVRRRGVLAALVAVLSPLFVVGHPASAVAAENVIQVNFQPELVPVPSGYLRDFGEAYTNTRAYGWISQSSTTPKSIVGRGRDRDLNSDQRLDTFIHMNAPGTSVDGARWEYALPNAQYEVSVSVGDAGYVDSKNRVSAEGVVVINTFIPTASQRFGSGTVRVAVNDGKLTLDGAGGTNTKINYVIIKALPLPTAFSVNFQSQTAPVPAGYDSDYGLAYDASRGFGWISQTSSAARSIVGRGRDRDAVSDQRLDTFIHVQSGTGGPARWEHALAPGDYAVTVSVGDALYTDSVHRIAVEDVAAIPGFTPTTRNLFASTTVRLSVTDGRLTLDSAGGTNTKLNYVVVRPATDERRVLSSDPVDGASDVPVRASVTLGLSHQIDNSQAVLRSLQVVAPDGTVLPGTYNGDAAQTLIGFSPSSVLAPGTTYTVRTTSALVDEQGLAFTPYTATFTTSTDSVPPSGIAFHKSTVAAIAYPTVVTLGPDGNLYVATGSGLIKRFILDAAGVPTGESSAMSAFANKRTVLGLAFDPHSTPEEPILWVSNGALGATNAPNFSGMISVLTGPDLATRRDVITGLPRATKDHMNNGITFGPDGKLYIAQGSLTGYGAADATWGNRDETPLSAAILVADVDGDSRFADTVNVDTSAGYVVGAANAPVKLYATGTRNPYDLVWHSNGMLYAPVNESADGNAPAGPSGTPPALTGLPAGRDYLARLLPGRYYGHPDPARGEYVLNGGNPTSGVDPFETPQYPVGVQPESTWDAPILDLGLHRSADGITEYRSDAFGGALQNQLLFVEFSGGDDIVAVKLADDGTFDSLQQLYAGLDNPLDITADPRTGNIYVAEYSTSSDGKVTLLRPAP